MSVTPLPCDNCGHAYGDHTDRTLMADGSGVGPRDRFDWGGGCSVRVDWHHTCPCAEWDQVVDGKRVTQRSLAAVPA